MRDDAMPDALLIWRDSVAAGDDGDAPHKWLASTAPANRRDAIVLAALVIALGMVRIGNKSVWYDEAVSAEYAGRTLAMLVPELTHGDPNMSLYYLLLNLWRRLFGDGEIALRSLSAIAAAGAVVALYAVGARLFGRWAGSFAAVLMALNSFMLWYAQMARAYALVVCLVTVSCWLFVIELERPSPGARVAFVIVSASAVYAHYFAALVLLAQVVTLFMLRRRFAITPARVVIALAIAVACLPALAFARARGTGRISWIPALDLLSVPGVVVRLAGGSIVVATGFCVASAWAIARVASSSRDTARVVSEWRLGFVLAWLMIPFGVAFVVSLRQPVFLAQYLIVCMPAFCLLTAAALTRLEPTRYGTRLLALCALLSLVRMVATYREEGEENWRAAEGHLASRVVQGDGVLFFPEEVLTPYAYYAQRNRRTMPYLVTDPLADSARRVWLVIRKPDVRRRPAEISRLRSALGATRVLSDSADFRGVAVELFARTR